MKKLLLLVLLLVTMGCSTYRKAEMLESENADIGYVLETGPMKFHYRAVIRIKRIPILSDLIDWLNGRDEDAPLDALDFGQDRY